MKGSLGSTGPSKVGIWEHSLLGQGLPGDEDRHNAGTMSNSHVNPASCDPRKTHACPDGVKGCSPPRDSVKQRFPGQTDGLTADGAW